MPKWICIYCQAPERELRCRTHSHILREASAGLLVQLQWAIPEPPFVERAFRYGRTHFFFITNLTPPKTAWMQENTNNVMSVESILSISASLLAVGGAVYGCYQWIKRKPLISLMNELADKTTPVKRQRKILSVIDRRLLLSKSRISTSYIDNFHSNGRSKLAIFYDICEKNNIEPTVEICKLLIGSDEKKFRNEWVSKRIKTDSNEGKYDAMDSLRPALPVTSTKIKDGSQVVYMSALLAAQHPAICKQLTDILNKHNVPFAFLEGTKDIWCRDYMPVQTPSGKLIQFKYDPSYLREQKYSGSISDVKLVDSLNNINPVYSEINLDGGNVVMYKEKAIISDRIFSENPGYAEDDLKAQLANLLECEIIIIPSYKPEYDFTGHADGMVRFVDSNTVIVNDLDKDFVYMKKGIKKALDDAGINYVNFPFFEYKIKDNKDHAIGVYLNYLEVGDLIVMPVFNVPGNLDAEALAKLKEVFPDKKIETIDYNEVALKGGLLNCTTWIIK